MSGATTETVTATQTLEGARLLTGTCTDLAGNQASTSLTAWIDRTPPRVQSILREPQPNAAGWNNDGEGGIAVAWLCADDLSGMSKNPPVFSHLLTTEGANQSVDVTCTDKAGNTF